MSTMNISLPDTLRAFVDEQVRERGYGTSSEYVRDLLRRERDRIELRRTLLEAAESPAGEPAEVTYFDGLRSRIRRVAEPNPNG